MRNDRSHRRDGWGAPKESGAQLPGSPARQRGIGGLAIETAAAMRRGASMRLLLMWADSPLICDPKLAEGLLSWLTLSPANRLRSRVGRTLMACAARLPLASMVTISRGPVWACNAGRRT
jgi:hypothetical protein